MQGVLNTSTAHLHSGQQAPLGRKGYSISEAVMVQVLKKELYDVRDMGSLPEVEKRRKGNEKGKRENFGAMFFMKFKQQMQRK